MPAPKRVIGLGEILWDVYEDKALLGGAPANFATHASSLHACGTIASAVGADDLGRRALNALRERSLDTSLIAVDPRHPTGTVQVSLDGMGQPTYAFADAVAWDFLECSPDWLEVASTCNAVCFGTLAQRSPHGRRAIASFLEGTSHECWRVFDVNLRQHFYDAESIHRSLAVSNMLKLNDEELPVVGRLLGMEFNDEVAFQEPHSRATRSAIEAMVAEYPLQCVALTLGSRGSWVWLEGDWDFQPPIEVEAIDTVGAGDAFSAALVMGLLEGISLDRLHRRAARIAAYVCTQRGAVPPLPVHLVDDGDA